MSLLSSGTWRNSETPAFFLFSWSGLQDYFSAKQVAKKWGHNPGYLKRYGRMIAVGLPCFWAVRSWRG
jgi:hypothetical protein